jgi:hypothetical protein
MRCRDLGAVVRGVGRRLWLWGRGLRSRWIDLAGGGWGGERGRTYGAAALPTVLLAWQRTKTPSPAERFVWLRTVAAAGKGVFATPSLSRATFRRSDVFQVGRESGIGNRGSGVGGSGFRVPGSGVRGPGSGVRGLGSAVRGAGCGVRGLSVFSYRGSPLPSSLFPLPSSLFRLPTSVFRLPSRDWSLVTGRWSVGVGQWTFNGPILAYRFRLSTCRSRRAMYDFQC